MTTVTVAAVILVLLFLILFAVTRIGAWVIARRYPPAGTFTRVNGARVHFVHVAAPETADLPPIVFVHGASANLNDQMIPLRPLLEGRAELLFLDRPGHGWSERGTGNETPDGQADSIAALMERLGIENAIIVGHSFGGAVAAAFALRHAEKTRGLLFLSAATHPWPGGATSWYYSLTALPVIGWLFSETLALPGGVLRLNAATACVFAPNAVPDGYTEKAAIPLVLRPNAFHANAIDVAGLYDHVKKQALRYPEISAPTVVVSGDMDTVVAEHIHSTGLARDIEGAELVWVRNLGHKSDWIAADLAVSAIEKLGGKDVDLQAAASRVEARIAADAHGPIDRCMDTKPKALRAATVRGD